MAKYKVQAPDGSIITIEGPDGASQDEIVQKAQSIYKQPEAPKPSAKTAGDYVKDFGKATASLADTGLNAITGTLDQGAYALARASGLSPEQATQETTSPKDVFGRAFGITQDPAYTGEASRQITGYLGENIGRSVVQPVSEVTGLPEQDVGNMLGTASMLIPGAVKAVKPAAVATGQAIGDVAKGAIGRGTGYIAKPGETPTGYQVPSSRIPLGDTFTPAEEWAKFQRGELPYGQFPQTKPIQELPTNTLEKAALMASGGEIPAAGQGFRAFGERLGETYRNPITAAVDIGSAALTGLPLYTMGKGVVAGTQAAADALLARKGFDPSLPQKMAGYRSGQIPMPGTPPVAAPVNPATVPNYPLTVQGPGQQLPPSVIPMGGPQRKVNIEGQRSVLPQLIDTSGSRTQTPKQVSQQMAMEKLQQIQQPTVQPVAPTAVAQTQPAPMVQPQTAPKTQAPKAANKAPVRDSGTIKKELDVITNQSDELHQSGLEQGLQYGTPASEAHQTKLGELFQKAKQLENELELAKKAEKKAGKQISKQPKNVSKMMTDEDKNKFFNKIKASGESEFEQKIAGISQTHRNVIEDTLRKQLNDSNKDIIQPNLDILEKYRTKK